MDGGGTPRSSNGHPFDEQAQNQTLERSHSTQILHAGTPREGDPDFLPPSNKGYGAKGLQAKASFSQSYPSHSHTQAKLFKKRT